MAVQGKLTPSKKAEYRAALDRLQLVEARHRGPRSEGERELHRIARWVLDRWDDDAMKLLTLPERQEGLSGPDAGLETTQRSASSPGIDSPSRLTTSMSATG